MHHSCKSKITILYPIDRSDRRAIVIVQGAHNRPMPPSRKVSRDGKDAYRAAVDAVGVTGLTAVKLDRGTSNE